MRVRVSLAASLVALAALVSSAHGAAARSDLAVISVATKARSVEVGGSTTVTDTTRNGGGIVAGKSTTRYLLSTDKVRSAKDTVLGTRAVAALRPKAKSTASVVVRFTNVAAGTYFVLACADDLAKVREANERNNCKPSASITVRAKPAPPVVVDPGPTPPVVVPPVRVLTSITVGTAGVIAPRLPTTTTASYTSAELQPVSRTYAVTGFDQFGESMGDVTASSTLSISPSGSCVGAVCGADAPGAHTVTALNGGVSNTVPLTVLDFEDAYTMTCKGDRYDLNDDQADGCEQAPTVFSPNGTPQTARFLGTRTDCVAHLDSPFSAALFSDQRAHTNPSVPGFIPVVNGTGVGAAPTWFAWDITDEAGCSFDVEINISYTGGPGAGCYRAVLYTAPFGSNSPTPTVLDTKVSDGAANVQLTSSDREMGGNDQQRIMLRLHKDCYTPAPTSITFDVDPEF